MLVVQKTLLTAGGTGIAYGALLSHRSDYLGHYLAGIGATVMLLCMLATRTKKPLGWDALAVTLVSIALGFGTEATIFRLGLFDPVDFCNQSLGACIACACLIDSRLRRSELIQVVALSIVLVGGGFVFAFA